MDGALSLAAAGGHDLAVLSELLPAAEAGMIEALATDRVRGNGLRSAAAMAPYCLIPAVLNRRRRVRV